MDEATLYDDPACMKLPPLKGAQRRTLLNVVDRGSGTHEENVARLRVLTYALLEWNGHADSKLDAFLTGKGNAMGLLPEDVKRVLDEIIKAPPRRLTPPSGQGVVMFDPKNLLTVLTRAVQVASGEAGPTKAHRYPSRNLVEDIRNLNEDEDRILVKALDLLMEAIQKA